MLLIPIKKPALAATCLLLTFTAATTHAQLENPHSQFNSNSGETLAFGPTQLLFGAKTTLFNDTDGHSHEFDAKRPDSHAPLGVMGDHTHGAGEIMLSYRYMFMAMDGSRDGDSRMGDGGVRADGFMVVPTDMDMEMHMFGIMYAPTDDLTLMFMLPYVRNTMNHKGGVPLGAMKFSTASEGPGDMRLSALLNIVKDGPHYLQGTLGFSFPTGSIGEKDTTPMGRVQLPYPMQLGSGTVDFLPSVLYVYQQDNWSWGNQLGSVMRMGKNHHGYRLGDRVDASTWFSYVFNNWLNTSVRLNYQWWDDISGRDTDLPPGPVFLAPTMDPERRGGQRLDVLVGVNLYIREGFLKGHRFAIEAGVPVYQKLNGPQLETDWLVIAGWQFAF